MKKLISLLLFLVAVSLVQAAVTGTVLFSDTYNRPDNTDIDASSVGMSGLLSPLTYVEIGDDQIYPIQSGTGLPFPELTQVQSNQLYMAYGSNMTTMYLDHNFVDNEILTADGIRIGMTILQDLGPQTGAQFFVGFGVGNTLQECEDVWFDHNGTGFRGQVNITPPRAGVSDLWIGWSPANSGTIQVFKNGPTSAGGENYDLLTGVALSGGNRLELELLFDSFADDSPVRANILWDGVVIGTESFGWDADGLSENYIGINGRQTAGFIVDDLVVEAVYEDRANQPNPADGDALVTAAGLELSWNKGKDTSGNPNAAITQHYLYIRAGEPNFVDVTPITVADTADPVTDSSSSFVSDTLYYWRIDESLNGSSPTDGNTITGYVWSFDTYTFPVIDAGPGQAVVTPTETAILTCDFSSVTTPTVKWFDGADVELTAGGDVTIDVTNTGGDAYATTLTIANVEVADEGAYYCQIENASGPANAVTSAAGSVGVKRQVAHWTLDETDLVDGQYLDVSGEGHHADPNLPPVFTTDTPGSIGGQALDMTSTTGQPLAAADSNDWAPSMYTGQVTVSAWLKWAGPDGGWQGVVSNRSAVGATTANFYIEIRQDNGNLQIGGIPDAGDVQVNPLPIGEWTHMAVTTRAGEIVIYINGEALNTNTFGQAVPQNIVPVRFGALNRSTGGELLSTYNGFMDDVQIYNYVLSNTQVVDLLYYDVMETPVCLNLSGLDLSFDVAGGGTLGDEPDCKVSMPDFAALANDWLNCGLVPDSECN